MEYLRKDRGGSDKDTQVWWFDFFLPFLESRCKKFDQIVYRSGEKSLPDPPLCISNVTWPYSSGFLKITGRPDPYSERDLARALYRKCASVHRKPRTDPSQLCGTVSCTFGKSVPLSQAWASLCACVGMVGPHLRGTCVLPRNPRAGNNPACVVTRHGQVWRALLLYVSFQLVN